MAQAPRFSVVLQRRVNDTSTEGIPKFTVNDERCSRTESQIHDQHPRPQRVLRNEYVISEWESVNDSLISAVDLRRLLQQM